MAVDLIKLAETIENLTDTERKVLNTLVGNGNGSETSVDVLLAGLRFSEKRVCTFCCGTHMVKNGNHKDGTQKYHCCECGMNPLATSNSILCGTHKDIDTWIKFIKCKLNDKTLDQSAEKYGIYLNTALKWWHKLHETVSTAKKVRLSGCY